MPEERTEKSMSAAEMPEGSWSGPIARFRDIASRYIGTLSYNEVADAFGRAWAGFANQPQIQNMRVKGISSLPADYTKEDIGEFLRHPYSSERPLRQTAEILKWTAYPFYKIIKTYQDILTYRYYAAPARLAADFDPAALGREASLLDDLHRHIRPEETAHAIVGKALSQGRVCCLLRWSADKSHNRMGYAFVQQLPTDWCTIIGENNISGETVSFNMMYFLQPGTDVTAYGDLFDPFLEDFRGAFSDPSSDPPVNRNYVYHSDGGVRLPCRGGSIGFHPGRVRPDGPGRPRIFRQNGRWCYYVSLPIDRVWVFGIDDTTVNAASPLSGLLLTYAQQSDYEAAQLSLLLNPLIKIFTGEIPYFSDNGATVEDGFRLSLGGRALYESMFNSLMAANSTGGTAFYTAPVQNIKSHDFPESANANDISASFQRYGIGKAGLAGIIPVDEDVKAGQAELSSLLESRYGECVYRRFERMMNTLYRALGLRHDWRFHMFGSIYTDARTREAAQASLSNGDLSAHYILAALDGESLTEKLAMMRAVRAAGLPGLLEPPPTSYTQSDRGGRPENDGVTEGNEKSLDAGSVSAAAQVRKGGGTP